MAPQVLATPRDPAHNPTEVDVDDVSVNREVLAGDPFPLGATRSDETVEAHYVARERLETSYGCIDGWVYLGFEGEDENGEHVEEIERVPCRRCRPGCSRWCESPPNRRWR